VNSFSYSLKSVSSDLDAEPVIVLFDVGGVRIAPVHQFLFPRLVSV